MNGVYRILSIGWVMIQLLISPFLSPPASEQDPIISNILSESSQTRWLDWIAALSGEVPIQTAEGEERILSRSSFVLFEPNYSPSAFDYLEQELIALGFREGIDYEIHTYDFPYSERYAERNWMNMVLTFQGSDPLLKDEKVLMVAHLDSTSDQETTLAPGADDNASGSAGLMEAAAIFRYYNFKRTIHLVWFSGEEQSRQGSEHFVTDYAEWIPDIKAVINLDMFAFDWDNDRCFEIHTGVLPGSQEIAETFKEIIDLYNLDLRFDLIDDESAYMLSDHKPFWDQGVASVFIFENGFYQPEGVCGVSERNTTYHSTADTLTYINPETGFSILQAAIGTASFIAMPESACFSESLSVQGFSILEDYYLSWEPLEGAVSYQIWRFDEQNWNLLDQTEDISWQIPGTSTEISTLFRIIALPDGGCQSNPNQISSADFLIFSKEMQPNNKLPEKLPLKQ